jgi:hypothetical protein
MSLSMYQASIPVFVRMLGNLEAILDKGLQDAEARKIDPSVFTAARLAPDMHPLPRQVQIACDMAKFGAARLAGVESPSMPDVETTFDELKARIAKTIDYVKSFKPEQIDGSEGRSITLKFPGGEMNMTGQEYLLGFVLPNLYFHVTAAYAILRHNGVPVGKMDFVGRAP